VPKARTLECRTPAGSLRTRLADSFTSRALGLLVGRPLEENEALLISPCSSIHTFGMRYPIDVVFVDRRALVIRVSPRIAAGRVRFCLRAHAALELRAGGAARHAIATGSTLASLRTAF
jgi:uncharacterized protein